MLATLSKLYTSLSSLPSQAYIEAKLSTDFTVQAPRGRTHVAISLLLLLLLLLLLSLLLQLLPLLPR